MLFNERLRNSKKVKLKKKYWEKCRSKFLFIRQYEDYMRRRQPLLKKAQEEYDKVMAKRKEYAEASFFKKLLMVLNIKIKHIWRKLQLQKKP